MKLILPCVVLALAPVGARAGLDDFKKSTRERGAVYLEDMNLKPVRMRLAKPVPIYYQADTKRHLGTMVAPAEIHLEGLSGGSFFIRGRAEHGQDVAGWVRKGDMPLDPKFLEKLKNAWERQTVVNEMIANKQVALGMNVAEVRLAMGEPTRISSHVDAEGKQEILEYAVFERVPQVQTVRDAYGRIFQNTVYVKVETGTLSVALKDGLVTSVSESKGNPLQGGGVKIVPPPVILESM